MVFFTNQLKRSSVMARVAHHSSSDQVTMDISAHLMSDYKSEQYKSSNGPQVAYSNLFTRFKMWKSGMIAQYGGGSYTITGGYSSSINIYIPKCGIMTATEGALGFHGFDTSPSIWLGNQTISLRGTICFRGAL